MERSYSVGRTLDWGSKSYYFKTHPSLFVMSLSKTLYYPLLSADLTQKDVTVKLVNGANASTKPNMTIKHIILPSIYSETCLKRPLKIDKTNFLLEKGRLMKVESIAECSLGAFCNTVDLH